MATYNLYLKSAGPNKLSVVKAVKEITGLGIKACQDLVNSAPCVIKKGYTDRSTADADMGKLTVLGAEAYVETIGTEAVSAYTFSILLSDDMDNDSSPVVYATVKLYTGENGQFITSGKTDTEGKFTYFTRSSNSDYIEAPNYAIIEKLRFISINKTLQWKTVSTSVTENAYALNTTYPYFGILMEPKGLIYFKPQYYDISDFKYKYYTGTLLLSCCNAFTGRDLTSSLHIPSAITQDTDGYYYPAVTDTAAYTMALSLINKGAVYFVLTSTDPSVTQGGATTPFIYFYPYNLFNSTGATDYTIQKHLTFYPYQKRLTISNLKRCYVSEYMHQFFKPNSNNTEYIGTFCPTTVDIRDNYYQNIQGYGLKLPSVGQLAPYSHSVFRIVLCVYENETYMYNGDTPTQYGGAKITVQRNGYTSTYNNISALTSTYTSVTTSSIYYTSNVKITLSDISAGLTFEKEKEEFYFIPGITEIRFNAYKHATSNPLRTIYVRPESASYNGKSSAKLICFCREGNFTHDVTLTCKWKTLNSTTTQSFTFTVSSGSNTFSYTLQPSANLDYGDQNWSMSFAYPSQALNDGYSKDIEIDKGMISLSCKTKEQVDGETTVEVNVNIPPVTDIGLLFTNERGYESYETFNARNYTQQYFLPFDGTISMSTTASSDAFYDYDY